ncbi:hypothetical protein OESDEN_18044 [Oesophagostomum dentatum]|uniref:Uncharacterized protein n=1 Tax=Oesophagostomum dentatum TaxID=61180 RepID=A0A0B1SGE9_OESDE|nr:hypothetical protein OESDEN_18044 [Oesophagostomum dentatum]
MPNGSYHRFKDLQCIVTLNVKYRNLYIFFYSDADLERLYEEWEENDDEKLEDDELPAHKRPQKQVDLETAKAKAKNPRSF